MGEPFPAKSRDDLHCVRVLTRIVATQGLFPDPFVCPVPPVDVSRLRRYLQLDNVNGVQPRVTLIRRTSAQVERLRIGW